MQVGKAVPEYNSIVSIDIRENKIKDSAGNPITQFLKANPYITSFKISGNLIGQKYIDKVRQLLDKNLDLMRDRVRANIFKQNKFLNAERDSGVTIEILKFEATKQKEENQLNRQNIKDEMEEFSEEKIEDEEQIQAYNHEIAENEDKIFELDGDLETLEKRIPPI